MWKYKILARDQWEVEADNYMKYDIYFLAEIIMWDFCKVLNKNKWGFRQSKSSFTTKV